jgi:hypothetical protein
MLKTNMLILPPLLLQASNIVVSNATAYNAETIAMQYIKYVYLSSSST